MVRPQQSACENLYNIWMGTVAKLLDSTNLIFNIVIGDRSPKANDFSGENLATDFIK